jgi:hypothetical protein
MAAIAKRSFAGVMVYGRPPIRPRARAEARPACPFGNQLSFEFGERRKDPEDQLSCGGGRIDRRTMAREHLETDALGGQIMHGIDQMV